MHKIIPIPQAITDRVCQKHGSQYCNANLNPKSTALIAIDMQNCFLTKEHASVFVPNAVDIIPNLNRLAAAVRESGGKVFWTQNTADENTLHNWSNWFGTMKGSPGQVEHLVKNMSKGSQGFSIHPDVTVKAEDTTITKHRFSAFIQGSSDLLELLHAQGIDTLIIAGTLTNVCCESTARDAMMLNFKVILVSDACAAVTDEEHNASLLNIYATFGDIMDTNFLIGCLTRNPGFKA